MTTKLPIRDFARAVVFVRANENSRGTAGASFSRAADSRHIPRLVAAQMQMADRPNNRHPAGPLGGPLRRSGCWRQSRRHYRRPIVPPVAA